MYKIFLKFSMESEYLDIGHLKLRQAVNMMKLREIIMFHSDFSGFILFLNNQGGSAQWIAGKLEKHKNLNFSSTTITTVFKICLYARCFDHQYVYTKFSDSTLPILLNFSKTILSMNLI